MEAESSTKWYQKTFFLFFEIKMTNHLFLSGPIISTHPLLPPRNTSLSLQHSFLSSFFSHTLSHQPFLHKPYFLSLSASPDVFYRKQSKQSSSVLIKVSSLISYSEEKRSDHFEFWRCFVCERTEFC